MSRHGLAAVVLGVLAFWTLITVAIAVTASITGWATTILFVIVGALLFGASAVVAGVVDAIRLGRKVKP
jgi:acyl-coenzyme A synthetase/AMP-(fatty) acid ligase